MVRGSGEDRTMTGSERWWKTFFTESTSQTIQLPITHSFVFSSASCVLCLIGRLMRQSQPILTLYRKSTALERQDRHRTKTSQWQ